MARYSSNPVILDQLLSFSISDLKKKGLLKPDTDKTEIVTWTSTYPLTKGNIIGSITVRSYTKYGFNHIELSYTADKLEYRNRIELLQLPSNLGKGDLSYFECPVTGKRCMKLYFYKGNFISRGAITGACYSQQTESKRQRVNGMLVRNLVKHDKIIRQADKPYYKIFYNGRVTKKYRKIIKSADCLDRLL